MSFFGRTKFGRTEELEVSMDWLREIRFRPETDITEGRLSDRTRGLGEAMEVTSGGRRSLWWYVKFVVACQAAGFALWMLVALAAMPFVGYRLFDLPFEGRGYLFLPLYLVCAPVVWKYLR